MPPVSLYLTQLSLPTNPAHIAMKFTTLVILAILLSSATSSSSASRDIDDKHKKATGTGGSGSGSGGGTPSFDPFTPGSGFGSIPGFGGRNGWGNMGGGYGGGYGGPGGGYARGGVVRPTVVCSSRGPCYKKKLQCPAKCFTSYSRSGKNYGSGGGGGGCTMDCKKHCVAYC